MARSSTHETFPPFLAHGGDMGALIAAFDWTTTPLGPLAQWPEHLRAAVALMLAAPNPVAIMWGPEHIQLYNDAYIAVAGDRHPAALGRSATDNWAEAFAGFLAPVFARVWAGDTVALREQAVELRAPNGDAETRLFTGSFFPMRDPTGAICGIFHPLAEITERVRADAAVREERQRLRDVLDGMDEGFGLLAPDFTILEYNATAVRMDGRAREDIVGRSHWDAFPGSEGSELGRKYKQAMTRRTPVAFEHRYDFADGRALWLDMRAYPTPDGGLAVFWRDITERKQAADTLRDSEARLRALTDNLPAGMVYQIHTGPDGGNRRFMFLSQSNEKLSGVTAQAVMADPTIPYRMVLPEDQPAMLAAEAEAIRTRSRLDIEVRFRHAVTGAVRWSRVISEPREQPDGSLIWDGIQIDITEIKEAEDRERRRSQQLQRLAETALAVARAGSLDAMLAELAEAARRVVDAPEAAVILAGADEPSPPTGGESVPLVGRDGRALGRIQFGGDGTAARDPADEAMLVQLAQFASAAVEQAQTDAALRESQALLSAVLDSVPVGIIIADAEGRVVRDNAATRELWGVPPDTASWEGYGEWVGYWPETGERIKAHEWGMARALLTGEVVRDELVESQRFGTGERRMFLNNAAPVRDEAGKLIGGVVGAFDVTERLAIERQLQESEARFRLMADAVPQIVWITDPQGSVEFFNKQWSDYTGTPYEPITAAQVAADHVHPDDGEATVAAFEEARRTGMPFRIEHRIRSAAGNYRWFLVRAEPHRDAATGEIVRWFGASVDIHDRKLAEEQLRDSEARHRALFENVEAGFCIIEVDTDALGGRADYRVVEANPAFFQQTGFPQTIVGRWLREAAPDLEEHWYEIYGRVARTGEAVRFEQGSDMLGRWFDVHAFQLGEPTERRVAILFNDISPRRSAEKQLRELNETLEQQVADRTAERNRLWNNSRDLQLVVGIDGVFRSVNPAWTATLGWSADELVGRSYLDFIHPDDHPSSQGALATASQEALPTYENRYRHKNGSFRWISWVAAPEGALIYASGRDVTADKAREAELAAAEAARRQADRLYRAYFENTAEALFVVGVLPDGGFAIEDLNPAQQASTGLLLPEVRGKRLEEFLPIALAEEVSGHYQRVLASGAVQQYRELFDLYGTQTWWDTTLVPVRDADGRIAQIIGASRDITGQIAAEEALRQAQKMEAMGQLTGGVAHDFNNLLTPIVGSLDLLQRKGFGTEREQRLIAGAAQSADRAKVLVQRLLAFARRQPLQSVPVDLAALVAGMGDLVASTTGPQIDVLLDTPADLPPAMADPNQLEMALLNLAVNARDAMPDGGALRIAARAEDVEPGHRSGLPAGRYLCMAVADTGAGMDAATLARAVEPFFSTKGVGRGTGLGLSMVHGLASQLGGALTLQSQPGFGTLVELWLPESATSLPIGTDDAAAVPAPTMTRATVLLVDDEELVRASTAAMLHELGFSVMEADSAESAGAMVEEGAAFDLLVTDHLMPGMTGTELARQLKARRPDLPVLLVSGYAESDGVDGALPILTKPFREDELASALVRLLAARDG